MTAPEPSPRRVALVTGSSRGLGLVLARFLSGQGYELVVNARDPRTLDEARRALSSKGTKIHTVPGDVADPKVQEDLRELIQKLGRLDLLVNNASELGPSPLPHITDFPTRELERVFRVNVVAPIELVQHLLPALRTAHGTVVNISSDAAVGGYPGWGGYGASKAALDLVSLTLAHELKDAGLSVVSVDPGDMRTAMHQAAFPGEDISDRPLPEATIPFWAWLLNQDPMAVSGHRFRAQADRWEVPE